MICGVYEIRNLVDNRIYVGSSRSIEKRLSSHKAKLRNGRHWNSYLQNAWGKYGEGKFVFSILLKCERENLLIKEQEILDQNDKLYNLTPVAGGPSGYVHSEAVREKIGRKNGRLGMRHSEEAKELIRQSATGRVISEETKAKVSLSLLGNTRGKGNKGRQLSEETKQKISKSKLGRRLSEEHKRSLSETHKARYARGEKHPRKGKRLSEETKQKISKSQKLRLASRRI